jgi:hypothetical protein
MAPLDDDEFSGSCADCGRPSRLLSRVYNRFTQSELRLCPACVLWHDRRHRSLDEEERERASAWRSLRQGPRKLKRAS